MENALKNPAENCTDCLLGTMEVVCPARTRDGETCNRCGGTGKRLHRTHVVWGEQPEDVGDDGEMVSWDVMYVGEAPGYQEDLQGTPFYYKAPAGRTLRAIIEEVGLDGYLTNSVKCRPPDNKLDRHPYALPACRKWLDMELAAVQPKVIVALGKTAGAIWFPGYRAAEIAGLARVLPSGQVVVGSYHPSYVARGVDPTARPSLVASLKRAKRLLEMVR